MFEYLGMLVAVILGLALTHLVRGLAKLIHERRTVRAWWPHVLWSINMIIYVLDIWFGDIGRILLGLGLVCPIQADYMRGHSDFPFNPSYA